jgi:membrane protein required for colicin V production
MENFSMTDFNYFDVAIGLIIVILGIKGLMQGFIKEIFNLIGLVAGVYFAARLAPEAAAFIDTNFIHLENQAILKLIGFLGILAIIWIIATLVGAFISKVTSYDGIGPLNRLLGFAVALGKYFLIFSLIITALSNVKLFKDHIQKYTQNSILYPHLSQTGAYLIDLDLVSLPTQMTKSTQEENNSSIDLF